MLFLVALKKLWNYILKSNHAEILMFIIASHKAGKKKKNDSERGRSSNDETSNDSGDGICDG